MLLRVALQISFVVKTQDHIQNKIVTEAMPVSMIKFSPKYFIRGLHDDSKRQNGKKYDWAGLAVTSYSPVTLVTDYSHVQQTKLFYFNFF